MTAEIWNTYDLAIAATTGGLIVGVATVGLMVLKRLDGARELATAKGWWEKAIKVQEANDRARWAPAYSENLFAIEPADVEPHDAEVLHVAYPTQELRLVADDPQVAAGLSVLADEVGLVQAVGCCTGHGDEPCSQDSGLVPPYCCDDCPDRTPALSDRPAADEDEVGDEQPGEWWTPLAIAAAVLLVALLLPVWLAWMAGEWAWGKAAAAAGYVRERFKSNDTLAAEWSTPVEDEYAGRRRSDDASVNPEYRSRHTHPDFQTGIFPAINASIPAQRTDGDL